MKGKLLLLLSLAICSGHASAESRDHSLADDLQRKAAESGAKTPAQVKAAMDRAIEDLRRSGILSTAVAVGTRIPDATLKDADGKPVKLLGLIAGAPAVVTFYRGGWCPFCNIQLHAYQEALTQFAKHGAKLVAISPETPDQTADTKKKDGIGFTVLSDAGNALAEKMGLVYKVPHDLKALYLKFGVDLAKNQGNPEWRLPLPATFVVDKNGVIVWRFVDVDYKKRAEPADIVQALEKLGS